MDREDTRKLVHTVNTNIEGNPVPEAALVPQTDALPAELLPPLSSKFSTREEAEKGKHHAMALGSGGRSVTLGIKCDQRRSRTPSPNGRGQLVAVEDLHCPG